MGVFKSKILTIGLVQILFFGILVFSANALDIISRTNMGLDETLEKQDSNYLQPDSIVVVPIYTQGGEYVSDYDWVKGIYYYQAVELNQGDFTFHYFVSKSGQIFQGSKLGEVNRFRTDDTTSRPVIIGYLAGSDDTGFDPISKQALSNLILDIAVRNAIPIDKVYAKSVTFIAKSNTAVTMQFGILGGRWTSSLMDITNGIKALYKPVFKKYQIKFNGVTLPQNPVNYGDNVVMTISLTNNSNDILLKGSQAEPVMNLSGGNQSKFFVNGTWLGLSQAYVMNDGTYLQPGETKSFQVRLKVPLFFGQVTEAFYLTDTLGNKYPNTSFNIALNVNHPSQKVIEISKTPTGQLNVRQNPWYDAAITNRVTPGERFLVIQQTNDGWINLDLGNGKSGWITGVYAKFI